MPTIHIHIPSTIDNGGINQAFSLVAMLLNQDFVVTIDLDEMSNIEANATRVAAAELLESEMPPSMRKAAIKAKIRAQRVEADAYIAEHDEREAKRRWHDEQVAIKAHKNNMRRTAAIAATDVECRSCGAKVGAQCVTPQGKPHPAYAHMTRIRDHHTAAGR